MDDTWDLWLTNPPCYHSICVRLAAPTFHAGFGGFASYEISEGLAADCILRQRSSHKERERKGQIFLGNDFVKVTKFIFNSSNFWGMTFGITCSSKLLKIIRTYKD